MKTAIIYYSYEGSCAVVAGIIGEWVKTFGA